MKSKTLNKNETSEFVDIFFLKKEIKGSKITELISDAKYWQLEINLLSYFASIVLEKKRKIHEDSDGIINSLYAISQDDVSISFNEIDTDFIDFMLRHIRHNDETLEETLVNISQKMSEYDYSRTIRM